MTKWWISVQNEPIIQQDLKVLQACLIDANNSVLLSGFDVTKGFVQNEIFVTWAMAAQLQSTSAKFTDAI